MHEPGYRAERRGLARAVAADEHELDLLLRREAGRRLVQEQEAGPGRERAGDLETGLAAVREVAGVGVRPALYADEPEQLHRAVADLFLLAPLAWQLEERVPELRVHATVLADEDVLDRAHVLE